MTSKKYKLRHYSLHMTLLRDILTMKLLTEGSYPRSYLKPAGYVRHTDLMQLNLPYKFLRVNELVDPVRETHKHVYIVTDQPVIYNEHATYTLEEVMNSIQEDAMTHFRKYLELREEGVRMKDNKYFLTGHDWEYRGARSKTELHKLGREMLADPDGHHVMDMQDAWFYSVLERRPSDGWKLDPTFYWRREGMPLRLAFLDDNIQYSLAHGDGLITKASFQDYGLRNCDPDRLLDNYYRGEEWPFDPPQL